MSSDHGGEDHSDLDSLFGDYDEDSEHELQATQLPHAPVVSLPRAATTSQNVGTIAHSPVPSSSEHDSSRFILSNSASTPLTRSSVRPESQEKRHASPQLGQSQPSKKRRVESDDSSKPPADKERADAFGLSVSKGKTGPKGVQAALNLLAPKATSRGKPRAPKSTRKVGSVVSTPSGSRVGAGTITDPVVIPDDDAAPLQTTTKTSAESHRITRSKEAHDLLEALPNDPADIISQTLRTILKIPIATPHSRDNVPRDMVIYLANGRYTGTPFLRLLRHLAGRTTTKCKKTGAELLKELVGAMRKTDPASKTVAASQSSAASTPVPVTPQTPSASSFPATGPHPAGPLTDSGLFAQPRFGIQPADAPFNANKQLVPDVVIDPELLAISLPPSCLSQASADMDLDLYELLGALPLPSIEMPGIDAPVDPINYSMDLDFPRLTEEDLASIPLDQDPWDPTPTAPVPMTSTQPVQRPFTSATQTTQRIPKGAKLPPGGMRIPPRSEALELLERARQRKAELEANIKSARRQAWACTVESAVERNLLEKLRKDA